MDREVVVRVVSRWGFAVPDSGAIRTAEIRQGRRRHDAGGDAHFHHADRAFTQCLPYRRHGNDNETRPAALGKQSPVAPSPVFRIRDSANRSQMSKSNNTTPSSTRRCAVALSWMSPSAWGPISMPAMRFPTLVLDPVLRIGVWQECPRTAE